MKTAMHLLLLCVVAVVVSAGIVDVPIARRALVPRGDDDDDCGKGAFGGVVSIMTLAATPAVTPAVTVTKTVRNKSTETTITITEDIFFDCDQYGKCTPTATSFSGPTASAKVSSKKHHSGSSKKGRKTATKLPGQGNAKGRAKSTPTPSPC